jgi:hypothetical protein
MSQQSDVDIDAFKRKIARLQELGAAVEDRWKRYGALGPCAPALRELLTELKKPVGRATHAKGSEPDQSPAKTAPAGRRN